MRPHTGGSASIVLRWVFRRSVDDRSAICQPSLNGRSRASEPLAKLQHCYRHRYACAKRDVTIDVAMNVTIKREKNYGFLAAVVRRLSRRMARVRDSSLE